MPNLKRRSNNWVKSSPDICEQEQDPGLGNGGLGRLAACFLDSLATLRIPAMGYGIRYQYGMFKQEIVDGQQVEKPDLWLDQDLAWQIGRPNKQYAVSFGGQVINMGDKKEWHPSEEISAMAYDEIIPGYGGDVANPLRLWTAHAGNRFDLADFNRGDSLPPSVRKTAMKTSRASSIRTTPPTAAANCA